MSGELASDPTLAADSSKAAASEQTRGTQPPLPRIRSRTPSLLPVGTQVGRYELKERLGAGGMGVVYRARDPRLDRDVAVKLVAVTGLADAQARLEREAQAMAKLSHPNVCTVHDIGTWDNQLFIAMELCSGGTLSAWTRQNRPWREVVKQYVAAGRGLAAAHALGILHRDFKPDNVMLGADGAVKVSDFGLARSTHDDLLGTIEGTPAFMSPEQLAGQALDERSDQYAFAVAMWSALCHSLPYQPDPSGVDAFDAMLRAIRTRRRVTGEGSHCPAKVRALLGRALEADPAERWPSLAALLDALERTTTSARRKWLLGSAVIALAVVVGIVANNLAPLPEPEYLGPEHENDVYYFYLADHAELTDRATEILEAGYRRWHNPEFLLREARVLLDARECGAFTYLARYEKAGQKVPKDLDELRTVYARICTGRFNLITADELVQKAEEDSRSSPDAQIRDLRAAARIAPNREDLWHMLADAETSMGYCKLAKLDYERFLRALPDEAERAEQRLFVEAQEERCDSNDMELQPDLYHATPLVPPP